MKEFNIQNAHFPPHPPRPLYMSARRTKRKKLKKKNMKQLIIIEKRIIIQTSEKGMRISSGIKSREIKSAKYIFNHRQIAQVEISPPGLTRWNLKKRFEEGFLKHHLHITV